MHGTQPLAGNCVRSIVGRSNENQPCTPTLFAKRRGSALRMRSRITGQGILDAIVGSALKSPARISSYRQLHHVVLPFRPDSERCACGVSQRKVACHQNRLNGKLAVFFFTGVIFDPNGETASTDSTFAEPLFERGPRGCTGCNRDLQDVVVSCEN